MFDNGYAKFTDYVQVSPVEVDREKKLLFECKDSESVTGYSLDILADVTFSGVLTANKAMYLPAEIKKAKDTFVAPYNKPVQLHHNDHKDPIGRVVGTRYIDTARDLAKKDSVLKDFAHPRFSLFHYTDKVRAFSELVMLSQSPDYTGLGRLRAHLKLSDRDSISKILDGRFLTLSSGFRTKEAWCSSCLGNDEATDWVKDGPCDHELGQKVNGVPTFLIPKGFRYDEVSFVNCPALPMSQVVEVHTQGFQGQADHAIEVKHLDSVGAKIFFIRKQEDKVQVPVIPELDAQSAPPLSFEDVAQDLATLEDGSSSGTGEQDNSQHNRENEMYTLKDVLKDTVTNYGYMAKHLDEDAQLTEDQVAALDDKVFLGPERHFPVPDLAHADAVRKVLDEVEEGAGLKGLLTDYLDKRAAKLQESVADSEADNAEGVIDENQADEPSVEDALKAQIAELEDKLAEKDQVISLLKKQTDALEDELEKAHDAHLQVSTKAHELLAEKVVDAKVALGYKIEDREAAITDHKTRTWESLTDTLADMAQAGRQDGLSRETDPDAQVDDPTQNKDENTVDNDSYAYVVDTYNEIALVKGRVQADSWLDSLRKAGYVPADLEI